ncbi:MAG: hypothetical protein ACRD6I_17985 [Candidatus Acidiferrales bacterium]
MLIMATIASLCAVVLMLNLLALACRHREDLWIASENAILCAVSPVMILLLTFGGVALGYRLTHGGLGTVSVAAWIGTAIIPVVSYALWRVLAPRLLAGAPKDRATAAQAEPARVLR